jgi:hypothetical protein
MLYADAGAAVSAPAVSTPAGERGLPARLQYQIGALWTAQARGGTSIAQLGPNDTLVGEFATGVGSLGTLMAIVRRRTTQGSMAIIQCFRPGPDGARIPITSALMVKSDLFALLGEAVLKLLELEADDQPSRPKRTEDTQRSGDAP